MHSRPRVLRPVVLAALLFWAGASGAAQPARPAYPNTEGFGVAFDKSEDWYRHCMRARQAAPRLPAKPAAMRCDAVTLYYLRRDQERSSPAEWNQVRACAEANGDDAVLMMLYANGDGVVRDTERAIYHACKLDAAKAEMEGRIAHLASSTAADGHPFDWCDHSTSGRMGAVCAAIGETRDERVRAARLERFAAALPPEARPAFARLRQNAAAFARESANEVDLSGTGGPAFALRHSGRRDEEFVETLFNAARGKIGQISTAQLAQLDHELNAQYRQVLAKPSDNAQHPERLGYSTVSSAAVRSAERAWLAYRDAWAPFLASARLPADLVSVKAALTRQRIAQLKKI